MDKTPPVVVTMDQWHKGIPIPYVEHLLNNLSSLVRACHRRSAVIPRILHCGPLMLDNMTLKFELASALIVNPIDSFEIELLGQIRCIHPITRMEVSHELSNIRQSVCPIESRQIFNRMTSVISHIIVNVVYIGPIDHKLINQ